MLNVISWGKKGKEHMAPVGKDWGRPTQMDRRHWRYLGHEGAFGPEIGKKLSLFDVSY